MAGETEVPKPPDENNEAATDKKDSGNRPKTVFRAGKRIDRPQPGILGELRYWLYYVSWYLTRAMFYIFFGLRLYGRKNVPQSGGFVVASNHQSFLDPIIAGLAVGPRRHIHYMARKTLFFPPFSWLIRTYNAFPIERNRADFEALEAASQRLKAGIPVLVFPEGTRTPDGKLQKVRSGAVRLAMANKVPMVPCYIYRAHKAWPKGKLIFRPIRGMTIKLGEPIMPEGDAESRSDRNALVERLKNALAKMEAEAYSGDMSFSGGTQPK